MKPETENLDPPTVLEPSTNGSPPAEERWATIPIEGLRYYQISTEAHIKNARDQLLSPYAPNGRAGSVSPWITLNGKAHRVDRLVLETFIGPPKSWRYGPRHLNGQLADCRLENLEWEYGLGRKPRDVTPTPSIKKSPAKRSPAPAKAKPRRGTPIASPLTTDVQERVFLESGNVTVMWDRTQGKVDVSQLPNSSPVIDVSDIPSLIKVLQHVVSR